MIQALKLLVLSLTLFAGVGLASPSPAHAAYDFFQPCSKDVAKDDATVCQDKKPAQSNSSNSIYGPNGIITKIANILAIVAGVAAIIVIIVSGIRYMLSTGDPTKVNNAKNALLYAVAGLLIVLVARTLVVYIVRRVS